MRNGERPAPEMQYEPFGEEAASDLASCAPTALSPLQRGVSRAGTGLFWTLVAAIVTARALLFAPHGIDGLMASAAQVLRATLGWA